MPSVEWSEGSRGRFLGGQYRTVPATKIIRVNGVNSSEDLNGKLEEPPTGHCRIHGALGVVAAIYGSNFKELTDGGKMGVGWAGHWRHCGTQGFFLHTHSVQDLSKTQTTCNMSCSHKEKHTKADASKSLYRVAAQITSRVPRMPAAAATLGRLVTQTANNDRATRADILQTPTPSNWGKSRE